ncbi:MAG: hypothetical protein HZA46_07350 [Planctomycetales bacterium]|nr:hypothetical protein [Planctomycetales bacterium]
MTCDPIVDEVRAIREAYAKQFNFDVRALCRDLQEQEKASGRSTVSFPPKRLRPAEMLTPVRP